MKYALIGCGRISPNHIMAARNNGLEIVAICDIVRANAEDKCLKFDLEQDDVRIYENYKAIAACLPDSVAIATSSGFSYSSISL